MTSNKQHELLRRVCAVALSGLLVWSGFPVDALAEAVREGSSLEAVAEPVDVDQLSDSESTVIQYEDGGDDSVGEGVAEQESPEIEDSDGLVGEDATEDAIDDGALNPSGIEADAVQNQDSDKETPVTVQDSANDKDADVEPVLTAAGTDSEGWNTSGTCEWRIDDAGELVVRPIDGNEGTLSDWKSVDEIPWYSISASISSVRFEGRIKAQTCWGMFYGCSNMTSIDLAGLDTSCVVNMSSMFNQCSSLQVVDLSAIDLSTAETMYMMFAGCIQLKSIIASGTNSSNVTDMSYMFNACSSLEELDFSQFDTSSVKDLSYLFSYCRSLKRVIIIGNDFSKVTKLSGMFKECSSLEEIELNAVSAESVVSMYETFSGCSSLKRIDLSSFSNARVTNMGYMFQNCSSLELVDLTPLSASESSNFQNMFYGCSSLVSLDITPLDTTKVAYAQSMFEGCSSLETIYITTESDEPTAFMNAVNISSMFANCESLRELDLSTFDTSRVKRSESSFLNGCNDVFDGCTELRKIVVGERYDPSAAFPTAPETEYQWFSMNENRWIKESDIVSNRIGLSDTYTIDSEEPCIVASGTMSTENSNDDSCIWSVDSHGLFLLYPANGVSGTFKRVNTAYGKNADQYYPWHSHRSRIKEVRISSGVRLPSVINCMFKDCVNLISVNTEEWDTSSVDYMFHLFSGCSSIESLNLSSWDMSKVQLIASMFEGCTSLTTLNIDGWNTKSIVNLQSVFKDCSRLESVDVSNWDVSSIGSFGLNSMFMGCSSLRSLDLSQWNTSNITDFSQTFKDCSSLIHLDISSWNTSRATSASDMFDGCTSLEYFKVGDKYNARLAFPESSNQSGKWWSTGSESWYSVSEIQSNRSYTADTYVLSLPNVLNEDMIQLEDTDFVYDGSKHDPSVTVLDGDYLLRDGIDYTVDYIDDINAGYASVILTGKAKYKGTVTVKYIIKRRDVIVDALSSSKRFGLADPKLEASVTGVVNNDRINYNIVRDPGEDVGTYRIRLIGNEIQGNYRVILNNSEFRIDPAPIDSVSIDPIPDQMYAKSNIEPELNLCNGERVLNYNHDYTVTYDNNTDIGLAKVEISGKGNYYGTIETSFNIVPREVVVRADSQRKAFGDLDPELTVTIEGILDGDAIRYDISRMEGEGIGVYPITPSGDTNQGNYVVTYESALLTIFGDISLSDIEPIPECTYNGSRQEPDVSLMYGGQRLVPYIDFLVEYTECIDAGIAHICIKGIGKFEGTKNVHYIINPRPAKVKIKDSIKVYGFEDPEYTAEVNGLIEGDKIDYLIDRVEGEDVGEYDIIATGDELQGNYHVTYEPGTLTIEPYTVTVSAVNDWKYYGEPDPEFNSTIDASIVNHPDLGDISYQIVREPGENVGDYAITFEGDEYQGNYRLFFEPAELSIAYRPVRVLVDPQTKRYGQQDPELTSSVEDVLPEDHIEYTLTRTPGEDVGDYLISATGEEYQGNYVVTFGSNSLIIEPASIESATIAPIPDRLFEGSAIKPTPEVTLNGKTLELGTDYTLSYRNNDAVGTATVVVTGINNYTGEATSTFRIGAHRVEDLSVMLGRELYLVSETPVRPSVSVIHFDDDTYDVTQYFEGTDFTVSYEGGDEVGSAKAIVEGKGQLIGKVELPYEVVNQIDIADSRARIAFMLPDGDGYVYRGEPIKPRVDLVPGSRHSYPDGVDYEVEYLGSNRIGTAIAVIRGTGDFTGETRLDYQIARPSSVMLDEGVDVFFQDALMYHWGVDGEDGVRPSYLLRPGESKPEPICKVYAKIGEDANGYNIMAQLTEGVDYELSYEYGSTTSAANYVVVTGIGDVEGTARASFFLEDGDVNVSWLGADILRPRQLEYRYNGEPVEPKLAYNPSFVEGTDYTLSYANNDGPGTCVVTVKGKGLFTGKTTIEVPIVEQYQKPQLADCRVVVESETYTGSPLTPRVTVTDPETGEQIDLTRNCYAVTYENNVNAGTGTVHVKAYSRAECLTESDYDGYVTQDFTIAPASIKGATVEIADQAYTGSSVEPAPVVVFNGKTLTQGSDYLVAYANNVEVGTATAAIIGRGNYTGTVTKDFEISNTASTYVTDEDYLIPLLPNGVSKTAYLKPPLGDSYLGVDSSCSFEVNVPRMSYGFFRIGNVGGEGAFLSVSIKDSRGVERFHDTIYITHSPGYCDIPAYSQYTGLTPLVLPAGMAHVEMSYLAGRNDYGATISVSCMFSDAPAVSLANAGIEIIDPHPLYWETIDGKSIPVYLMRDGNLPGAPEVRVRAENALGESEVLREGTDYRLEWLTDSANRDIAGAGKLLVHGMGAYKGTARQDVMLTRVIDVGRLSLTEKDLQQREYVYSGTPVEPKLRYRRDFIEGVDYTLSYRYNDRVGICVVTVEGIGEYYGSAIIEVPVVAAPTHPLLDDCEVVIAQEEVAYTGKPVDPGVVIIDSSSGKVLRRGKDYMLTFESNTAVGEAKVHVSACMDGDSYTYDGHNEATFTIVRASISRCEVALAESVECTGSALKPKVSILDTESWRILREGTDYTVAYSNNTSVGTATATITGKGGYTGTVKKTFKIVPAKQTITASDLEVQLKKSVRIGAEVKGAGRVTYSSSDAKVATVNAAGVVAGKKVGTAKITITASATSVYAKATKTITVKVGKANPLKPAAKVKKVKVDLAKVKKKSVKLANNVKFKKKGQGKITYANASTNATAKKFKVNARNGKITVPKGTKKGTYAVKISVRAAGNATYLAGTKTVKFKVIVK